MLAISDIFVKDINLKQLKEGILLPLAKAVDYMAFVCVNVTWCGSLTASLCEVGGV